MSHIDNSLHLQLKQAVELHQAGDHFKTNMLYELLSAEFPEQPALMNSFGVLGVTLTARITTSFLTFLDMENWIANNQEECVDLAFKHTSNLAAFQKYRATVRGKMQSTYLGSKTLFVSAVEANYHRLWIEWCVNE